MTKRRFSFTFFLLICFSLPLTATAQTVNIPDPNLRAAIENGLRKPSGATITVTAMKKLTILYESNSNIRDLTGLEHATNLTVLDLGPVGGFIVNSNSISDLSPLEGLTNLIKLRLGRNSISDISPLKGLTNLTLLLLGGNSISDISPLAGLINLKDLSLWSNSISDISPLAGLINLTNLRLENNSISDISPLAGLINLIDLSLGSSSSPLAGLINQPDLSLGGNSISDISPLAGLNKLQWLYLSNNSITDISPLAGLDRLTWLDLSSNSISDISSLVADSGLGWLSRVNLSENPLNDTAINTHIPALQSRGVTVVLSLDIPDPNLHTALEAKLGVASGAVITTRDMARLTELDAPNANITDLTGLEHATNLSTLDLGAEFLETENRFVNSNSVSDISPLAGLDTLTRLFLSENSITDSSPLAGLDKLTWLSLWGNSISDISPLEGLINLTGLNLGGNSISDISLLEGLINLTWLELGGNSISDISPLEGLNQLISLGLGSNSISDISAVAGLNNLTELTLWDNSISDLSPLAGLNNLTELNLGSNSISDILPLVANTGLGSGARVWLRGNPLNSASINTHLPALQSRGVTVEFDDIVAQPVDVNGDGVVNIFDLVSVASHFGKQGQNLRADVNRDGVVDVRDLVLVAGMFGEIAAAPSAQPQTSEMLTAAAIRQWLADAKALEISDPIMERGVGVLQQLLTSLTPRENELLANYPNPFNPETWIPYRLAEDAFVTLTIYDGMGQVVRTIDVGHQTSAVHESRSKAIYWDGRNELGEQVASGMYFYHLSAGDYSATRKMVILK